jgi:hypothetical protein
MNAGEKTVRGMTKADRRAYLRAAGWHRLSRNGSESWFAPGWYHHPRGHVEPGPDRGFYTLAAAIRAAVRRDLDDSPVTVP